MNKSFPLSSNLTKELKKSLHNLSNEAKELYLPSEIKEIHDWPQCPLIFHQEFVSSNKPVIIKSAIKHWPAYKKWNHSYLRRKIGSQEVSVSVTPNGFADAPFQDYFVLPHEKKMAFTDFIDIMENPSSFEGVYYVQKQNSNLTEEFSKLLNDVEPEIEWFSKCLRKKPDAVNFWMGDGRSVTSMHKDNYENIYCVIKGYKDFILHPPTDLPWIPYRLYPVAKYKDINLTSYTDTNQQNSEELQPSDITAHNKDQNQPSSTQFDKQSNSNLFVPQPEMESVPWISIDPLQPDLTTYPNYKNITAYKCRVMEGDALYLPSLWFHHVQQSHGCIAVNYWYDMEYDIKYNYHKLLENLCWNFQIF